jgi:ketosteroid isomerase-like protein
MSSEATRAVLDRFYSAFARRDGATMAACYSPEASFNDPAFELRGPWIGAMWRMLCERAQDFSLEYQILDAGPDSGKVKWTARYLFSQTGRKVVNHIEAQIQLKDGLIVRHVDRFSFWRWARQALGPIGALLGWSQLLRAKVRAQALKGLKAWVDKNGL